MRTRSVFRFMALVTVFLSPLAFASPDDFYIYPAKNQSNDQLEKDRYECYLWATKETGYDPSVASRQREPQLVKVPVRNEKQGASVAGTVIGAIAGAAIGNDHHRGDSAAVGAVLGTMVGSSVEAAGQQKAEAEAHARAQRIADQQQAQAEGSDNYRRAFTACLEGRGYVVK